MASSAHKPEESENTPSIRKWKRGRYWAVFDESGELIVVAVYRKGAEEVKRRLTCQTES